MAETLTAMFLQNPELANAIRRQQFGASLMQQGTDSSPIRSPWQGLSRLAQALVGGYEQGQADKDIKEVGAKRSKLAESLMAPYGGGMPAQSEVQPTAPVAPVSQAPLAPPDMAALIEAEATKRGMPPQFATALFGTESGFNPTARNPKSGAFGLGQVLASTMANPGYGMQPTTEAELSDPRKAVPWSLDYLAARGKALGVTDWNDPQQQARALRAYGENTDDYVTKVQSRMGQGVQVAGPGAPTGQPQRMPGTNDLGEAQYYEQQAMRAQAAGLHQEAQMLMMRAQRAQQAALARQPQETEAHRIAVQAGLQPGTPAYQEMMLAILKGKAQGQVTNITMPPQTQTGPIPPGYQLVQRDGALRMEVIPGGPADKKATGEQKKEDLRDAATARSGNIVIEDIDRVGKLLDTAVLPATGMGATTLSGIPGTAAHDVSKLLDGIKGNIAFDKLQQMREASPTGGALGAVSERELALLQSVFGSLEQSQGTAQFKQNLQRLRTLYLDIVHGAGKWKEAAPGGGAETPLSAPSGDRPPLSSFAR